MHYYITTCMPPHLDISTVLDIGLPVPVSFPIEESVPAASIPGAIVPSSRMLQDVVQQQLDQIISADEQPNFPS